MSLFGPEQLDPSRHSSLATESDGGISRRFAFAMLSPILVLLALVTFFPPDGNERTEWAQFIGRFHPLVIHFPIALFLIAPILELAGRNTRFSHLRLSASFVLGLATIGAVAAAFLGWCLGRSGGYSGPLITQHMWGGVLLALACWISWLLRAQTRSPGPAYAIVLAVGVGLVAWTGYRGGQLSLGTNHLTEHMPPSLRGALGVEASNAPVVADPNTFYGARVQPILTARCIGCHSAGKHKGDLRLDNYWSLTRGGKHGAVVQAGNIKTSDLFRRISLPSNHDEFMPKGKPPLSADQIKVIELWISAGASDTLAVDAIKNLPNTPAAASVAEVTFPEIDPAAVAKLRSPLSSSVVQLQKQYPGVLDYDSRASADLRLNASMLGTRFGDRDLDAFASVAGSIISADLSHTAITDHSAATIAAMKRLRVLQLTNTKLTDTALSRLGSLDELESLSVFGTSITPAVLSSIAKLPKLEHFYVGQTAIATAKPVPDKLSGKLVF